MSSTIDESGQNDQIDDAPLRIAARDAANIYFDSERAPSNIVDVYVFSPPVRPLDTASAVDWLVIRMESVTFARRRLHRTWFDIDYPAWVVDDTVALADRIAVIQNRTWQSTKSIIADQLGSTMDLTEPPWNITVITGVTGFDDDTPDGATVVVMRIHHSVGDGVATAAIGSRLFGACDDTLRPIGKLNRLPGRARLALCAPIRAAQFGSAIVLGALKSRQVHANLADNAAITPSERPAQTRLCGPLRGEPAIGLVHFRLDDVRRACGPVPATVNDVMLEVVSAGLTSLLNELGDRPDGTLTAMMPIAVQDLSGSANRFALDAVDLCTGETNPRTRLAKIHEQTDAAKARQHHPLLAGQRAVTKLIPAFVTRMSGDKVRRQQAAQAAPGKPVTMISNVPSKADGAAFCGAPIIDRFGVLTISDGARIAHFVSSVGPVVSLAFSVDSAMVADCGRYEELLREAFDSLLAAAKVRTAG